MIAVHATVDVAQKVKMQWMEQMSEESGRTVTRQWLMLQAVPRFPGKTTTAELEARLHDEGFEINRRTIERDLHTLSARFPLILDDRSKPYGWSWAQGATFEFMPRMTNAQAVALLLARTHLQNLLPLRLDKELAPIFDAAAQALASSGWGQWHSRTATVPTGLVLLPPKLKTDVLANVQSALARRRCLRVRYRTKGSRQAMEYTVHPLGQLLRGPVQYLVCTLFDHEDVVQLALHRMTSAVEIGEVAKEPADFDFQRYAKTEARQYGSTGPIRLVAQFHPGAAEHLLETPLSSDQRILELDNGWLVVSATVQDDELLLWWLRGFGSLVEVIAPTSLRQAMMAESQTTSRLYQK